jgi:transcriptional regulator with XRE-family HTH domain
MTAHRVHHGHNIKRLREIQGVKQQSLALELGEGWSQKKISVLEGRPTISRELLTQIAGVLKVPPEAIEQFDEAALCQQLSTATSPQKDSCPGSVELVEMLLELMEENRTLYQQLLQAQKEKCRLLEQMMAEKGCKL